ncbi:copper resistance CopC/CopD family protein [Mesorhizobium sp. IMUNJ 23232]|uniref:copper resistance CopC/CopD family protein n=1 Tax=Mesorhizobium sp. IMUNJ 23232 TaxID=3376064 RepID=UPI0037891416
MHGSFLKSLAAAILLAAVLLVGAAGQALAHAQLISADPADGSIVAAAPQTVTLRFSEPARPLVARLIHPGGHTEILKDIGQKGSIITLTLPGGLENGTHILSWRVASSDGHPIGGGLVFSIGAPSAVAPAAVDQSDPAVRIGLWSARFVLLVGLIVGVGGTAFFALISRSDPPPGARGVTGALLAGLLAAPALIGFQGLDALGAPFSDLVTADVWHAGLWATSYGRSTLLAAMAICVAYAAGQAGYWSRLGIWLASAATLLVGVAVASAGHASTAPPRYLTAPAVFLHAVTAVLWIGALLPLGAILVRGGAELPMVLRRFSRVIPAIVAVLALSGLMLAIVQVQTIPALWNTDYGRVLMAKLALVAALLLLAALNRFWLTTPVVAGDAGAARRLTRSVGAEIVVATAVIAVLGLWRFTPPPRAIAANPALFEVQQVRAEKDGISAVLSIHPSIAGPVRVEIGNLLLDGKPFEPISVSVDLDKPSYGIGPFTRDASKAGDGTYRADGFLLPLDGFWIVRVTVLVSDFRSVTLIDVFDVRKASQ